MPKLFVVDAVTALDLAVLFRPAWRDVTVADAGRLYRQRKLEREFAAVIALDPSDRKRHRRAELAEERQAGSMIQVLIQPEHAEACAIVERGVLEERCRLTRTNLTSTWTESPGCSFAKRRICFGRRLRRLGN